MVQNLYNPANVSQAETISKLFKVAPIDTMTNGRCHTIHWEPLVKAKIQQTKMLVTCQRLGDLFLFGLVWQYSSVQTKYNKVGSKS